MEGVDPEAAAAAAARIQAQIRGRAARRAHAPVAGAHIPRPGQQQHQKVPSLPLGKVHGHSQVRASASKPGNSGSLSDDEDGDGGYERSRAEAAAKIQAVHRGIASRRHVPRPMPDQTHHSGPPPPMPRHRQDTHKEPASAAAKIQAQFRGRRERKQLKKRASSATRIQAHFRGQRARTQLASSHGRAPVAGSSIPRPGENPSADATASAAQASSASDGAQATKEKSKVRADQDTKDSFGPSLKGNKKSGGSRNTRRGGGGRQEHQFYDLRTPQNAAGRGGGRQKRPVGASGVGPAARIKQLEDLVKSKDKQIAQLESEHKEKTAALKKRHSESVSSTKLASKEALAKLKSKIELLEKNAKKMESKLVQNEVNAGNKHAALQAEMEKLKGSRDAKQARIIELEREVEAEAKEFEALLATISESQQKLTTYQSKTEELQEVVNFKQDELDKKKVIIRKLDLELAKAHPPTEDVCLSARSFSENDLIAARDAAIDTKEKQIGVLNAQCEALMDNVSTIEDTIPPLQKQLEEYEAQVDELKSENKILRLNASGLQKKVSENKGREQAVKTAMDQNVELLKLLQKQEAVGNQLRAELDDYKTELARVRDKEQKLMHELAAKDAALVVSEAKRRDTADLEKRVLKLKASLEAQTQAYEASKSEMSMNMQVELETMQEELQSRREKQYLLMNNLSNADQDAVKAHDDNERLQEAVDALTERIHELEQQLVEANQWRQDDERQNDDMLAQARQLLLDRDATIKQLSADKEHQGTQLLELSDTIQQVRDWSTGATVVVHTTWRMHADPVC